MIDIKNLVCLAKEMDSEEKTSGLAAWLPESKILRYHVYGDNDEISGEDPCILCGEKRRVTMQNPVYGPITCKGSEDEIEMK